jgi:hypothetical protein
MDITTFTKAVASAKTLGLEIKNAKEAEQFLSLGRDNGAVATPAVAPVKRGPGRPKGSKSKKTEAPVKPVAKKTKKVVSKRGLPVEEGTSCAKEIMSVLDKAKKPLFLSDIMERLGKGGHSYKKVNVSVALGGLAKKGTVLREGEIREYQFSLIKAPVAAAPEAPAPVADSIPEVAATA